MVRLEDDVSYAVLGDGIRLPVGAFLQCFQKFRAESPLNDFLFRSIKEGFEEVLRDLTTNPLFRSLFFGGTDESSSRLTIVTLTCQDGPRNSAISPVASRTVSVGTDWRFVCFEGVQQGCGL